MHKFFARCLSLALALIMVLSMSASAQGARVKVELSTPEGVVDASVTGGFDADGCEQFILESAAFGKWLLQSDGMNFTFGSDEEGYITVSRETLSEVMTAFMYLLSSELPVEEIMEAVDYLSGPAFNEDVEILTGALAEEVNRFASVAVTQDLITISENGDLYINATFEQTALLFAGYLANLSANPSSINRIAGMNIFKLLEVPAEEAAAQLPAMIAAYAAELASYASYALDGGFTLSVLAAGEMHAELYFNKYGQDVRFTVSLDENDFVFCYSLTEGDNLGVMMITANSDGVGCEFKLHYEDKVIDAKALIGDNSFAATANVSAGDARFNLNANFDNNESVCKFSLKNGSQTVDFDMDFDDANDEYILRYNSVVSGNYASKKFNFEYIDDEMYIEYITTEGGRTTNNVIISGSNIYRVNGTLNTPFYTIALNGTLRVKNGALTFEGDLAATSKNYYLSNMNFSVEASVSSEGLKVELVCKQDDMRYVLTFVMSDGACRFEIDPVENNKDVGGLIITLTELEYGYAGTFDLEVDSDKISASFTLDENGIIATFIEDSSYGDMISGKFAFTDELFEIRINNEDEMTDYRVFLEKALENGILNVEGGVTAEQQSYVMEALKLLVNLNLMTLEHSANVTVPMFDAFVGSSFDGEKYAFVYNVDGETVTVTARLVEEEGNSYILLEGDIQGMPVTAKLGVKLVSENEARLYVTAKVNGSEVGAAIVAERYETDSSVISAYSAEISRNGYTQTLGTLTVTYEILPGNLEHVEGYEMSADEIMSILGSMLSDMMY